MNALQFILFCVLIALLAFSVGAYYGRKAYEDLMIRMALERARQRRREES